MHKPLLAALFAAASIAIVSITFAQTSNDDAPKQPADTPPAQSNNDPNQPPKQPPTPEQVIQDLLKQREQPPVVEPTVRPAHERPPATAPQLDPRVIGVAPDGPAPMLRREGEFVIARTGRLVRAPGPGVQQSLFVFDADSADAADPPVFLMPCQMLQNMETIVQERGDAVRFILSGQVFTYRGANYLLPTMMKLSVDRGNLER
jgi:hypothetical protein